MRPTSTRAALLVAIAVAVLPAVAGGRTAPAARAAAAAVWVPSLPVDGGTNDFQENLSAFPDGVAYAYTMWHKTYFRSTDFGRTWAPMPAPPFQVMTDGTEGPPVTQVPWAAIRFATPELGYSHQNLWKQPGTREQPADDPGRPCRQPETFLSRTTDGGATWTPMCLWRNRPGTVFGPWCCFKSLHAAKGTRTVVLTGVEGKRTLLRDYSGLSGVVYTSHDAGERWVRAGLPRHYKAGTIQPMSFADARHAALFATDRKLNPDGSPAKGYRIVQSLLLTRDGGRSYRPVLDCAVGDGYSKDICTSVAFVTRSRIVVGLADGRTKRSEDGGRTWRRGQTLVTPPTARDQARMAASSVFWLRVRGAVQGLSFADARHGFASTIGHGTWRTTDGGVTWDQERSHECEFGEGPGGEIAAATAERAIVGGRWTISARVPLTQDLQDDAPAGCADPAPGSLPPSGPFGDGASPPGPPGGTPWADPVLPPATDERWDYSFAGWAG